MGRAARALCHQTNQTMNLRLTHSCFYVLDQDSALDFYVNKLGFKKHTDVRKGEFRWLTVTPPDQPDLEISLLAAKESHAMDKESADALAMLIRKGLFGFGSFQSTDVFAAYEEMHAKGVEFKAPPKKEFYGVSCNFKDDSGNWFSLSEIKK